MLASHETVEIVDEATYVWNGTRYIFSPERSRRNDVALGEDRPYVVRVAFTKGATSAVLLGSIAGGFGDDYEFAARAGRRISVQIRSGSQNLRFDVYRDHPGGSVQILTSLNASRAWNAVVPASGTWKLSVYGADSMDRGTSAPYALVLTL